MKDIEIVEIDPVRVIGTRKKGAYHETAELIPKVFEYAMSRGLEVTGPPIFLCHELTMEKVEEAVKNSSADLEVALPVNGEVEDSEDIHTYELPAVKMIRTIHKGPYQKVGEAYERLFAWMAENGKEIKGPYREHYLNDPREVPEEEILTEVYAQIE
jgi:effector-binding domain-containing protein